MTTQLIYGQENVIGPWVAARTGGTWTPGRGTAIGVEHDGELVAGVLYEDYNGANLQMHIAAEPGCHWATRGNLRAFFSYPFDQLKCKRITGVVADSNLQSENMCDFLGMKLEAVMQDAHPLGNLNVYRMTRAECRWL